MDAAKEEGTTSGLPQVTEALASTTISPDRRDETRDTKAAPIPMPSSSNDRHSPEPLFYLELALREANVPHIVPGDHRWADAIKPFNARCNPIPAIVIPATTVAHVQHAVRAAASLGYKVSAKSGGHSYGAFGLGGEDGHAVIDMSKMYGVTLHADGTATVLGGSTLGHVAAELWKQGKRAISHGSCPGVGLAGHALHGGYGFSSHKHGLALDWVVGAKVVLPDGVLVAASESENRELFWALCGAGSSFGIVVEFTLKTFDAPTELTWFRVKSDMGVDRNTCLQSLKGWQAFVEKGIPRNMFVRIFMTQGGQMLDGMFYGGEDEARKILEPLTEILKLDWESSETRISVGDWHQHLVAFSGRADGLIDMKGASGEQDHHYASSLVAKHIPDKALERFVDYWFTAGTSGTRPSWWIQMDVHGGPSGSAIAEVPGKATSYPHRDKMWLFQFFDPTKPSDNLEDSYRFLGGFVDSIMDNMAEGDYGQYANYLDSELGRRQAQEHYYGDNLPRLRHIKAEVDPDDVFHCPQSVDPAV